MLLVETTDMLSVKMMLTRTWSFLGCRKHCHGWGYGEEQFKIHKWLIHITQLNHGHNEEIERQKRQMDIYFCEPLRGVQDLFSLVALGDSFSLLLMIFCQSVAQVNLFPW